MAGGSDSCSESLIYQIVSDYIMANGASRMVHLRIPETIYARSQTIVKENGFVSIQEFLRNALRDAIDKIETQMAIERLRKLKGSVKGIKRLTEAERTRAYEEAIKMTPEQTLELFRKYGLDKAREI